MRKPNTNIQMNKSILLLISLVFFIVSCDKKTSENKDFTTLFEKSNGTETPEYEEVIAFYKELSETYDEISLFTFGETDSGKPLHLVVYNKEGIYNISEIESSPKNNICPP